MSPKERPEFTGQTYDDALRWMAEHNTNCAWPVDLPGETFSGIEASRARAMLDYLQDEHVLITARDLLRLDDTGYSDTPEDTLLVMREMEHTHNLSLDQLLDAVLLVPHGFTWEGLATIALEKMPKSVGFLIVLNRKLSTRPRDEIGDSMELVRSGLVKRLLIGLLRVQQEGCYSVTGRLLAELLPHADWTAYIAGDPRPDLGETEYDAACKAAGLPVEVSDEEVASGGRPTPP